MTDHDHDQEPRCQGCESYDGAIKLGRELDDGREVYNNSCYLSVMTWWSFGAPEQRRPFWCPLVMKEEPHV